MALEDAVLVGTAREPFRVAAGASTRLLNLRTTGGRLRDVRLVDVDGFAAASVVALLEDGRALRVHDDGALEVLEAIDARHRFVATASLTDATAIDRIVAGPEGLSLIEGPIAAAVPMTAVDGGLALGGTQRAPIAVPVLPRPEKPATHVVAHETLGGSGCASTKSPAFVLALLFSLSAVPQRRRSDRSQR